MQISPGTDGYLKSTTLEGALLEALGRIVEECRANGVQCPFSVTVDAVAQTASISGVVPVQSVNSGNGSTQVSGAEYIYSVA